MHISKTHIIVAAFVFFLVNIFFLANPSSSYAACKKDSSGNTNGQDTTNTCATACGADATCDMKKPGEVGCTSACKSSVSAPASTDTACEKIDNVDKAFTCKPSCDSATETDVSGKGINYSCAPKGGMCCRNEAIYSARTLPKGSSSTTSPSAPAGSGYCAGANRENPKAFPENTTPTCTLDKAEYVQQKTSTGQEYSEFCDKYATGSSDYLFKCPTAGDPSAPTPTPFVPQGQGGQCNPAQGPWQCAAAFYCTAACNPTTTSCDKGRCCLYNQVWNGFACAAPIPTEAPPAAATATPTPTVIVTTGTCSDVIVVNGQNVSQTCVQGTTCPSGQQVNSGGGVACTDWYGASTNPKTTYTCCQKANSNVPGGSSCDISGRVCNPATNAANGSNIACTGCGGSCIKTGASPTVGTCGSVQ